jgi:CRISPR-associated protein (TIGR02584 family)
MKTQSILLAVTGLTPQVVTETLYALHDQGEPLPSSIRILTTAEGSQRARLTLINDGWLVRAATITFSSRNSQRPVSIS